MSIVNKRKNLIALIVLFATSILACYQFVPLFLPECEETTSKKHTIEQVINFEAAWEKSPIFIDSNDQAIYLVANNEHLVFYGKIDACQRNARFINLSTINGDILFNGTKIMPSRSIYDTAYTFDSDLYILGYSRTGKFNHIPDFTANTGGVAAYSMKKGEIIWSQPIPGTRDIDSLLANNHTVAIDGGFFSNAYYLLDSQTGDITSTLAKSSPDLPEPGANVNMAYWYDNETNSHPPNIENIAYWAEKFEQVFQPPILTNYGILIRREQGTKPGTVATLDKHFGESIWETSNDIISNVTTNGTVAFFLTSSAELIAIDIETGEKVGSIHFSSDELQTDKTHGYIVAANEDQVFAYFGDSHQLLAFRFVK